MIEGKLSEHLAEIDKTCYNLQKDMVSKMAKQEGITEQLKADIIKVENFLLIFPLVILRLGTFSAFCTMKFHCKVNIFPFFRI